MGLKCRTNSNDSSNSKSTGYRLWVSGLRFHNLSFSWINSTRKRNSRSNCASNIKSSSNSSRRSNDCGRIFRREEA